MAAVLLSLTAAVCYGLADFVGGSASRRASAWSVALVAQLAGALGVWLLSLAVPGDPTARDFAWALGAGLSNGVGTAFLYRGLSRGRMGVVAPVSGVGAVAIPVLAGVLLGERPTPLMWLGILIALPGIWLVSREPAHPSAGSGPSGLVDGMLAGVGFGGLFVCLAQIPEEAGFVPLALNQVVAGVAIVVVAVLFGGRWVPREPAAALGIVGGLLAAAATGAFLLATQTGFLTVAAVITSLYPAVTVALAATVLHEPVQRSQAAGLACCLAAIALVASG